MIIKDQKVNDVYLGVDNKKIIYEEFLSKYKLNNSETVYMGDDLPDISVLKICGLSTCPNDASNEVRLVAEYISIKDGKLVGGVNLVFIRGMQKNV